MIPAPDKEPNTVYTCLKSLEKTFRERLRQKNAVETFDEGVYCVEALWIESDICGSNVATKIISGMHYNRAIRAHELTLEPSERL